MVSVAARRATPAWLRIPIAFRAWFAPPISSSPTVFAGAIRAILVSFRIRIAT